MLTWIVSLMLLLQPQASWKASYEVTAIGILEGAKAEPIFQGESGLRRTIAFDVALAWFESRFDPSAVGDSGRSRGLYQVQYVGDVEPVLQQTIRANQMIKESFRVCRYKPFEERLGWYASGGNGCSNAGGLKASRHRVLKAKWLEGRP